MQSSTYPLNIPLACVIFE